ncbi:hypothetical protein BZM27_43770, partial [Paraburkholderia steynii]
MMPLPDVARSMHGPPTAPMRMRSSLSKRASQRRARWRSGTIARVGDAREMHVGPARKHRCRRCCIAMRMRALPSTIHRGRFPRKPMRSRANRSSTKVAHDARRDPVALRLDHLDATRDAGAREIIRMVSERAAWGAAPHAAQEPASPWLRGRGFAFDG